MSSRTKADEIAARLKAAIDDAHELQPTVLMDSTPGTEPETLTEGSPIPVQSSLDLEGVVGESPASSKNRYIDLGLLGKGGMGEVRRVRDSVLNRVLAMKIMRLAGQELHTRFFQEAQITAQLQHPAIVPVHEIGTLADGRLFFTMKEVEGQTLSAVIAEAHTYWRTPPESRARQPKWSLRQLIGILGRASEGVGYAHGRGVLHRDIKPSNIMIGAFGEVMVMDWGLTRVGAAVERPLPADAEAPETGSTASHLTRFGTAMGTPGFMSPEQAGGNLDHVGPPADVFSLGCTLYHILTGSPPLDKAKARTREAGWAIGTAGELEARAGGEHGPLIPAEIREICRRAMAHDPAERFRDGSEFASALASWLDGAQRREQAMRVLEQARELKPQADRIREQAGRLEREAAAILIAVPPFAPVDAKRGAWALQDRAAELRRDAEVSDARFTNTVHAALSLSDDLAPAHDMLAEHYKERHAQAEAARDAAAVIRFETLLRAHDNGRFASYLKGDGALTLVTDPPGAHATLYRFEEVERRLVPRLVGELGETPLRAVTLPMGSYLVKLACPGRMAVDYPVLLDRELHWDGVRPRGSDPFPVYLPAIGELRESERYVPAGWFWSGGDPQARNSLPARRLWLDGFATPRFPVTVGDYLEMLNELAAAGRHEDALAALPAVPEWEDRAKEREFGFSRDAAGKWIYDGGPERLRLPMVLVSWAQAHAYGEWLAAHRGASWHLIHEMEHEKAGRGADGRFFPWGNYLDPTFCLMRDTHAAAGRALRSTVDDHPLDESPYGVRGLAGNTHSWCEDAYSPTGPHVDGGIPRPADPANLLGPGRDGVHRMVRGGSYRDPDTYCRMAFRDCPPAIFRINNIGFRVARFMP